MPPHPADAIIAVPPPPRRFRFFADGLLVLLVVAVIGLAGTYLWRPDALAAITVFPVWIWAAPALWLMLVSLRARPGRTALVALLWITMLVACADEPTSLLRGAFGRPVASKAEDRLRVITFNCGGVNCTAELAPYEPDIVLLQESPSREAVERFGAELFGQAAVVWSSDASLVADGELLSSADWHRPGDCFVRARVRLRRGATVEVVSLRLVPPLVRWDLWSPDCWRAQAENRRARRAQLADLLTRWSPEQSDHPLLLGGDFNAPAGDGAMDVLGPRFTEAGAGAARGWGNTITNEYPVLRIDQVWTSAEFESTEVTAHASRASDHRFVVCDLRGAPH